MIPLVCSFCLCNLPQEYVTCDNDCGKVYCSDTCWDVDGNHDCGDSSSDEDGESDDDD